MWERWGPEIRTVARLAVGCVATALAACSVEPVRFTPPGPGPGPGLPEDCEAVGDEDGNGAADCDDPACAGTSACAPPPTCTDAVKNGDETDVDCGGSCPACGDGDACGGNGDCDSGLCGAGSCARLASCAEILAAGFSTGDGSYSIDPDEAGGEPAFVVVCDMTTDGGGWTRFNWVRGAYAANLDPFELRLSQCAVIDPVCRGRIPASATPTGFMVKDLGDGDVALWQFNGSVISNAVLGALRDKVASCVANQAQWQPYFYGGAEVFCGTSGVGCDSFVYTSGAGCATTYTGWYTQLDDDTGCYNTAFKMGMTHTGYEGIGCTSPDVNYLDDGPTTDDDATGELYYR